MLRKIKETIQNNDLIKQNCSILIGLSGGADSVALTHALYLLKDELKIKLYTAHLNHGIRGEEAIRDENFAKTYSQSLGIECFIKRVNIKKMADGKSEELVGRNERYSFFEELCSLHNIDYIATAHNKNDNAETILMNLVRGTALSGLGGIPYKRNSIIRPLLDVDRKEIEDYCIHNSLDYVTDSTNLAEDYTRNKIRHSLIPLIEEKFNPNFISTLADNCRHIKEDVHLLDNLRDEAYNKIFNDNYISISGLLSLPRSIARRVVHKFIADTFGHTTDISSKYIDSVLNLAKNSTSGKIVDISSGYVAATEYDKLFIRKKDITCDDFEYTLSINHSIYIKEADIYIAAVPADKNEGECFTVSENCVIKVRNRRNGDIFYPTGMTGKKKVKDYYIDKKIPLSIRNEICIVTFDDEIGYIVGHRRDRRFDFAGEGIKIVYSSDPINI